MQRVNNENIVLQHVLVSPAQIEYKYQVEITRSSVIHLQLETSTHENSTNKLSIYALNVRERRLLYCRLHLLYNNRFRKLSQ